MRVLILKASYKKDREFKKDLEENRSALTFKPILSLLF